MNQMQQTSEASFVPWWKQRWPWILISGPLIAAIGCGITIWLAFSAVDQPIREGVMKQGLKVIEVPVEKTAPSSSDVSAKGAK